VRFVVGSLVFCWARALFAATTTVTLGPLNTFNPASITVNVGDTVHWDNSTASGGFHSVSPAPSCTEPLGNSPGSGWTYDYTFNNPGAFAYFCQVHGLAMSGVVNVSGLPGPGTPTATPSGGGPIHIFAGAHQPLLAPNPLKIGQSVCLYMDSPPAEGVWDVYNTASQRVSHLSFSGSGLQCWDSTGFAPGLYYVSAKATLADGSLKKVTQKVVLWH
jgi:plastocyanin